MSTGDELLRAIAENPDDDTVRLVYADWLEESGDADRSAFVRAQVDAEREPPLRVESPGRLRVKRLWRDHGTTWIKELPPWARKKAVWKGGTLHGLGLTAQQFLQHGADLFRSFPTLHTLDFSKDAGLWPDLTVTPAFAQVRGLDVGTRWMTTADVAALLTHAGNLRTLSVSGWFDDREWFRIGSPGVLPRLTHLTFRHHPPITAILAGGGLSALTSLSLGGDYRGTGTEGLRQLTEAPFWPRLHHLELLDPLVDDDAIQVLHKRFPSAVRRLHLQSDDVTPAMIASLATSSLPNLMELTLQSNALGLDDLRPLFESLALRRLYVHGLSGGPPDPSIFRMGAAAQLTDLGINFVELSDFEVTSLAGSPNLSNLVYLDLGGNPWGDKGARALAASPYLTSLTMLVVRDTQVTDRGLAVLRARWDNVID